MTVYCRIHEHGMQSIRYLVSGKWFVEIKSRNEDESENIAKKRMILIVDRHSIQKFYFDQYQDHSNSQKRYKSTF